jgi:hypothetical protein
MMEEITVMPGLFGSNVTLCRTAQFFHCYFALMNIIVLLFLVEAHRSSILEDPFKSRAWIHKYGPFVYLIFPVIEVIPYLMNNQGWMNMGNDDEGWCSLPVAGPLGLEIGVFFVWVWMCLIVAVVLMVYSAVILLRTDRIIGSKFLSNIGILVVIAIASWIPRSLERSHHTGTTQTPLQHHALSLLPINISGIIFGMLFFFFEKPSSAVIKELKKGFQVDRDTMFRSSFTWETADLDFLNEESKNMGTSTNNNSFSARGSDAVELSMSPYVGGDAGRKNDFMVTNPIRDSDAAVKNMFKYDQRESEDDTFA